MAERISQASNPACSQPSRQAGSQAFADTAAKPRPLSAPAPPCLAPPPRRQLKPHAPVPVGAPVVVAFHQGVLPGTPQPGCPGRGRQRHETHDLQSLQGGGTRRDGSCVRGCRRHPQCGMCRPAGHCRRRRPKTTEAALAPARRGSNATVIMAAPHGCPACKMDRQLQVAAHLIPPLAIQNPLHHSLEPPAQASPRPAIHRVLRWWQQQRQQ
jgi:hypothetical protein